MKFKVGDKVKENPEYFGEGRTLVRGTVIKIEDNVVYVEYCSYNEKMVGQYSHSDVSLLLCSDPNDILKKLL